VGRKSCFSPPDTAYSDEYRPLKSLDDYETRHVVTSASKVQSSSIHAYDAGWSSQCLSGGQISVPNSWQLSGSNGRGSDAVGSGINCVLPITPSVGQYARGAFNATEICQSNTVPAFSQTRSLSMLKPETESAVPPDSCVDGAKVCHCIPVGGIISNSGPKKANSFTSGDFYIPQARINPIENQTGFSIRASSSPVTRKSCDSFPWNNVQPVSSQTCSFSSFLHVGVDEQPVMSQDKEEDKRSFDIVRIKLLISSI